MIDELQTPFKNVMIIDDNAVDLFISARIITKNKFCSKLFQYSSAEEALAYLTENQENLELLPQIIFVDIYMPVMTGFEFIEAYEKLSPTLKNNCQAFIISSSIDDKDISRANNDKNIVGFHEKPMTKDFLSTVLS